MNSFSSFNNFKPSSVMGLPPPTTVEIYAIPNMLSGYPDLANSDSIVISNEQNSFLNGTYKVSTTLRLYYPGGVDIYK